MKILFSMINSILRIKTWFALLNGNYLDHCFFKIINYDSSSESDYYRAMIKFEFSSKKISNKFFLKNSINAKEIIGPRQTFFSEAFDVDNCEIIDKLHLSIVESFYFYDQGYKRNY